MDIPWYAGTGIAILGIAVWLICAVAAYQRAPSLGRRNWVWGVAGIFAGPFALFIMYLLPRPKGR
jgi:hypothetical protein